MRWRTSYLWALGAVVAFVALLVFDGRPNLAVADGCVSAPTVPSASAESAPVVQLLQSHFEWCSHALRSINLSLALQASRANEGAHQVPDAGQPQYGPLHRRPPPSLS